MSIEVELPDTAAREAIILTHLRQHCKEHVLGNAAVDSNLMQVQGPCICCKTSVWPSSLHSDFPACLLCCAP